MVTTYMSHLTPKPKFPKQERGNLHIHLHIRHESLLDLHGHILGKPTYFLSRCGNQEPVENRA